MKEPEAVKRVRAVANGTAKPETLLGQRITFLGVFWDDGWEFEAPGVIYSPFKRYTEGGNSGAIELAVDDFVIDLCLGGKIRLGFHEADLREFEWRGWSPKRFKYRVGFHVKVVIEFVRAKHGDLGFKQVSRTERFGSNPFAPGAKEYTRKPRGRLSPGRTRHGR